MRAVLTQEGAGAQVGGTDSQEGREGRRKGSKTARTSIC